jgi:hypothetical protein
MEIKTAVNDFDNFFRRTIKEFHTTERERRTLQPLLRVFKKRWINFRCGR